MEGYYWIKVVSVLLKMLHGGIVWGGSIGVEGTGEGKTRPYLIVEFHASSAAHCLKRLVC